MNEILDFSLLEGGSVAALRGLSYNFNAHMRALKNLGTTVPSKDSANSNLIPTWESLIEFLWPWPHKRQVLRWEDVKSQITEDRHSSSVINLPLPILCGGWSM